VSDIVLRHGGATRMNWSRWIVDCAHCTSGLVVGVHLCDEHGTMVRYSIEWGDWSMVCWDCGQVTEAIAWPPDPAAIEAILSMRPDEKTRNWEPGETLDGLLMENILHGIMPPDEALEQGGPLIVGQGDYVIGGYINRLAGQFDPQRRVPEIGS
jgi:hypothetical protein